MKPVSSMVLFGFLGFAVSAVSAAAPGTDAPGRSAFATAGSHRIHYVSAGSGPGTIVLIHGWSGSTDTWRLQVTALRDRARVIVIDLPGHGKSDKPQTAYSMEFFAQAIDAVVREAKVDKAVFAGFSMGVPVVCRYYKLHPAKVQALVAVDGTLRRWDMAPERREQFLSAYRGDGYLEAATRFIGGMFPNPGSEALRDRVLEDVRRTPRHVMLSAFEGMLDFDAWLPVKIDVPLLVVNARSPFWPEDYEQYVRQLNAQAEYHLLEGTGHFLMLEKPTELNRLLVDFLGTNGVIPKTNPAAASSTDSDSAAEWRALFDGQSLAGWRLYGKQAPPEAGWKVEDGVLKKLAGVRGGDIIHEDQFDDFEFSWEWRMAPGGNNGVKYLVSEARPGAPGHEYQLLDDAANAEARVGANRVTASFYHVLPPAKDRPLRPAGHWNESRILVRGNHVEHWLNGMKVLEYKLGSPEVKAAIAQSKFKNATTFGEKMRGHVMLTDHRDECWFRNLKVRELR